MNTKWLFAGVVLGSALAATALSRVIWPDIPGMQAPTTAQLPLFIIMGIIEAVAFGLGLAFLIFGFSRAMRAPGGWAPKAAFFSAVWSLVSWWPHDNLHRVMPEHDYWFLLKLEYGFHLTLIIAGGFIAYYLWTIYNRETSAPIAPMGPTIS